ncbi:FAD-dependent oxidoreductase [Bacillaceae bacterium IKA-2]|nr:FAD-dependent oxidoreductase [Bacillaceae bacterium IKA-2]
MNEFHSCTISKRKWEGHLSIIDEVDVVIIGAGLAGLATAFELKKNHLSFVVLEARDRPGGRIESIVTDENVCIDMGAQWIGKNHYRVKKLLSQFRLDTVSTYRKGKQIYAYNEKITYQKRPPISALSLLDVHLFTRRLNKISSFIKPSSPWENTFTKQFDEITMEQFLQSNMHTRAGKNYYRLFIEELLCTKLYEVSALDFLWLISSAGSIQNIRASEELSIKGGAGRLVERIAATISEKIHFESPVSTIRSEAENRVYVYSKNQCWKAKKVIVAVPPNLQSRITFEPPLPATRAQLIERAPLPAVMKINLIYEKPFWRDLGLSGITYSDKGQIKMTIDSSPKDGEVGILTIISSGDSTRELANHSPEKRKIIVLTALTRLFGPSANKPSQYFEKNWAEEEWTRGGYGVHFAPGVITSLGKTLVKSIGPIHWAGSETASLWRLYMEGAVQSGQRAAQEVILTLR